MKSSKCLNTLSYCYTYPDAVKDRIVLIGTIATSVGDAWSTPYGIRSSEQMPGVLIQAQMLSQILSVVLDQRSLL